MEKKDWKIENIMKDFWNPEWNQQLEKHKQTTTDNKQVEWKTIGKSAKIELSKIEECMKQEALAINLSLWKVLMFQELYSEII